MPYRRRKYRRTVPGSIPRALKSLSVIRDEEFLSTSIKRAVTHGG